MKKTTRQFRKFVECLIKDKNPIELKEKKPSAKGGGNILGKLNLGFKSAKNTSDSWDIFENSFLIIFDEMKLLELKAADAFIMDFLKGF